MEIMIIASKEEYLCVILTTSSYQKKIGWNLLLQTDKEIGMDELQLMLIIHHTYYKIVLIEKVQAIEMY